MTGSVGARAHASRIVSRSASIGIVLSIALAMIGLGPVEQARAMVLRPPGQNLATAVDNSGTDSLLHRYVTASLRERVPAQANPPRVLVIGTGVQESLFPASLNLLGDLSDPHGYGTLAASVVLQLAPQARVESIQVAGIAGWSRANLADLASALETARLRAGDFDAVLLAFPPSAALDPLAWAVADRRYGTFGNGLAMVEEAVMRNTVPAGRVAGGVPLDDDLRQTVFAHANLLQRTAVEDFAAQVSGWNRLSAAVKALADAGVAVVAPSGDITRRVSGSITDLPTQTVYGLSALPEVITVGAAYAESAYSYEQGGTPTLSPTSGRGPTLSLGPKPDVAAPSDVIGLLPPASASAVPWPASSVAANVKLWPDATACGQSSAFRCVLDGSSMVSAAVVAANLAGLVAGGLPHSASSRQPSDDEVLRGIAWSAAGRDSADLYSGGGARVWEQGAGVFEGILPRTDGSGGFVAARDPVVLAHPFLGEVGWKQQKILDVPVWTGAAVPASVSSTLTSFAGPDVDGETVFADVTGADRLRVSSALAAGRVSLVISPGRYQGGIYSGDLSLTGPTGETVRLPLSFVQALPLEAVVGYGRNDLQGGQAGGGERVERATVGLLAGVPTSVGLVGEGWKYLSYQVFGQAGGDPTSSIVLRHATTRDYPADTSNPQDEGRASIPLVPPGFYRIHVFSDYTVDAAQSRGRRESLGVGMGSSGPEQFRSTSGNFMVSARPPCSTVAPDPAYPLRGPLTETCLAVEGSPQINPDTNQCILNDDARTLTFDVYCDEVTLSVPAAVVSRGVHLVEYSASDESELATCGVGIPLSGNPLAVDAVIAQALNCAPTTQSAQAPTAWNFREGASECLGPTEKARYPAGHPSDVTASYDTIASVNAQGKNLAVAVMSYTVKLPDLNTYTKIALSFSYVADNTIVAVRVKTSKDGIGDAGNGLVVVAQPSVVAQPLVQMAERKGSVFQEFSMMSSNSATATVSLVLVPTSWVPTSAGNVSNLARAGICDLGLRVDTYSKRSWGLAASAGHTLAQTDGGERTQIDPATSRIRPVFCDQACASAGGGQAGTFIELGAEREDMDFAVHIPKNTTTSTSRPLPPGMIRHVVQSATGGPARFSGAVRGGNDILDPAFKAYDPRHGVQPMDCNSTDPVCMQWKAAKQRNAVAAELFPDMMLNGRFFGVLPVNYAALTRHDTESTLASGQPATYSFGMADADDDGAFDADERWARSGSTYPDAFAISDFYDEVSPADAQAVVPANVAGPPPSPPAAPSPSPVPSPSASPTVPPVSSPSPSPLPSPSVSPTPAPSVSPPPPPPPSPVPVPAVSNPFTYAFLGAAIMAGFDESTQEAWVTVGTPAPANKTVWVMSNLWCAQARAVGSAHACLLETPGVIQGEAQELWDDTVGPEVARLNEEVNEALNSLIGLVVDRVGGVFDTVERCLETCYKPPALDDLIQDILNKIAIQK